MYLGNWARLVGCAVEVLFKEIVISGYPGLEAFGGLCCN